MAAVNDTNPASKGKSYSVEIKGSNYNHFLGKKIGDVVDGQFVGEGDQSLLGYSSFGLIVFVTDLKFVHQPYK